MIWSSIECTGSALSDQNDQAILPLVAGVQRAAAGHCITVDAPEDLASWPG